MHLLARKDCRNTSSPQIKDLLLQHNLKDYCGSVMVMTYLNSSYILLHIFPLQAPIC